MSPDWQPKVVIEKACPGVPMSSPARMRSLTGAGREQRCCSSPSETGSSSGGERIQRAVPAGAAGTRMQRATMEH